jgi:hypothetical protein
MRRYFIILLIVASLVYGCSVETERNITKVSFLGDSILLLGSPDSTILSKFLLQDEDYTFPFNNLMSMSVILEPPAIYHCFFLEQVETNKQIYYIKIDDGIKYNWIPSYDSLLYDLSLDFVKTEMAGCTLKNRLTGKNEFIKPDNALKWSSKYEKIPSMRKCSAYYDSICLQCNDAAELTDFYNNSLFFQNKSFVCENAKKQLLDELIGITQLLYVEYFFDLEFDFEDYINIINGNDNINDRKIIKVNDFQSFKDVLTDCSIHIKNSEVHYRKEHIYNDVERYYSKYLLNMNKNNLNYLLNCADDIKQYFNKNTTVYYNIRPYYDIRLFFFNIKYDENNKITIEKNYYNKEYITTSRIRGYY